MVKERIRSNNFFLTDNFFSTKTSPPARSFTITGSQTYVDIYERTDRLTAEIAQVNMVAPHRSIKNQHEVRSILAKAATNILIKHIYLTPHDSYMSPLPSRDCVAIRHPGQVRRGGREPGSRKNLIILDFHWIPDLARLGGLVRNDGLEEIHENSYSQGGNSTKN